MSGQVVIADPVPEAATSVFTCVLTDQAGVPLTPALLTSLTLTLVSLVGRQIVNLVDHVNILNTRGSTLDNSGNLSVQLGSADNAVLNERGRDEVHQMLIEARYGGGQLLAVIPVLYTVQALPKVRKTFAVKLSTTSPATVTRS